MTKEEFVEKWEKAISDHKQIFINKRKEKNIDSLMLATKIFSSISKLLKEMLEDFTNIKE